MMLRLRLLTQSLDLVRQALVTLDMRPDVVTVDGRRYLKASAGDTDGAGVLTFDYVEETVHILV